MERARIDHSYFYAVLESIASTQSLGTEAYGYEAALGVISVNVPDPPFSGNLPA